MSLDATMKENAIEMPSVDTNLDSPETMENPSLISRGIDYILAPIKKVKDNIRHNLALQKSISELDDTRDEWTEPGTPYMSSSEESSYFKRLVIYSGVVGAIIYPLVMESKAPGRFPIGELIGVGAVLGAASVFSSLISLIFVVGTISLLGPPKEDLPEEEKSIPYGHKTSSEKEDYISQFRTLKTIDGKLTDTKLE